MPSWRFVVSHPAHAVAFLGGIGLIPFAPGTFGTLVALPAHAWLVQYSNRTAHLLAIGVAFAIGMWAAGRTSDDLGVPDHGGIVWDEMVAFLLVLYCTPPGVVWQVVAFVLFRVFDIVKPQPIRHFDQTLHGGFGAMFDDLLAAGYSVLCLLVLSSALT